VTELEGEVAARDAEIARLKGAARTSEPDASRSKVLAAPLAVVHERTLDHEIDDVGLEAIADVLRERLRLEVTQVGRTLRAKQGTIDFELAMADGQTRIRLEATYTDRRNGVFVAAPMGALMATFFAGGILASLGAAPFVMAAGLALVAGVVPVGLAGLLRRVVSREQANVAGTFEAVLALAAEHAPKEAAIEARVETSLAQPSVEVAEEDEEEAEDGEEAELEAGA